MAKKNLRKALAFCLTAALCMGLFCMQAMAVNEEIIIEEEIFIDENGLPLVDIPDEPIPITELPEGIEAPEEDTVIEDLPDLGVPLAAVPHTGDISSLWLAVSGAGLLGLSLIGEKRGEEK
ncbi:MAG: LPXTG cell wall anchor domain-containing protein [Butyricicoccus sp.]|nr:LPXTG cell wall anchor domain-containing protein [Butyricicoccus sp.]